MADLINVDKLLENTSNLSLDVTGRLKTVSDEFTILQTAQNRCVSEVGSWFFDKEYGSELYAYIKEKGVDQISEVELSGFVNKALNSMIADGRIVSVVSVKIVGSDEQSVTMETELELENNVGTITYNVRI